MFLLFETRERKVIMMKSFGVLKPAFVLGSGLSLACLYRNCQKSNLPPLQSDKGDFFVHPLEQQLKRHAYRKHLASSRAYILSGVKGCGKTTALQRALPGAHYVDFASFDKSFVKSLGVKHCFISSFSDYPAEKVFEKLVDSKARQESPFVVVLDHVECLPPSEVLPQSKIGSKETPIQSLLRELVNIDGLVIFVVSSLPHYSKACTLTDGIKKIRPFDDGDLSSFFLSEKDCTDLMQLYGVNETSVEASVWNALTHACAKSSNVEVIKSFLLRGSYTPEKLEKLNRRAQGSADRWTELQTFPFWV